MCGKLNFLSLWKFIVLISSLVNSCIALDSQLSLSYFLGIQLLSLMHFDSVPLQMEVFPSPFWNLFRSFLIFLGSPELCNGRSGCVCVFVAMYCAGQQLPKGLLKEGGEEIPWLPPSSALPSPASVPTGQLGLGAADLGARSHTREHRARQGKSKE